MYKSTLRKVEGSLMGDTFFFTVIFALLCLSSILVQASLPSPVSQVVLVLWHGMEWEDIQGFNGNQSQALG